jgi:transcription initiation factor IIE alpha subunit
MKQFIIISIAVITSLTAVAQEKHLPAVDTGMAQKAIYHCPMHPEVTSNKPGKCSKCGMELVKIKTTLYTCPMHPEITSDKPGKCSKCGMELVKVKSKAKNKKS